MGNPIFNIFLFSFILFNACKIQSSFNENKKPEQIIFGSGGGFTGKVIEYTLNKNGEIYLNNTLKNQNKKIKTLTQFETKEVYDKLKSLDLKKMQFKHPGNMYYFIKLKSQDSLHEVIWGDNRFKVAEEVKNFYKFLLTKVQ